MDISRSADLVVIREGTCPTTTVHNSDLPAVQSCRRTRGRSADTTGAAVRSIGTRSPAPATPTAGSGECLQRLSLFVTLGGRSTCHPDGEGEAPGTTWDKTYTRSRLIRAVANCGRRGSKDKLRLERSMCRCEVCDSLCDGTNRRGTRRVTCVHVALCARACAVDHGDAWVCSHANCPQGSASSWCDARGSLAYKMVFRTMI